MPCARLRPFASSALKFETQRTQRAAEGFKKNKCAVTAGLRNFTPGARSRLRTSPANRIKINNLMFSFPWCSWCLGGEQVLSFPPRPFASSALRFSTQRARRGARRNPVDKGLRNIKYLCVKGFPELMPGFPQAIRGLSQAFYTAGRRPGGGLRRAPGGCFARAGMNAGCRRSGTGARQGRSGQRRDS